MRNSPSRVVIVDDSNLMRKLLTAAVEEAPDLSVVGTAADPFEARRVIKEQNPDVITLDVEMPKMDGLEFLMKIMSLRPTPVVMVSGATTTGAEATISALEIGAIDFVAKPSGSESWATFGASLRDKIRIAAKVRFDRNRVGSPQEITPASRNSWPSRHNLVAIGASTGGVTALKALISELPEGMPPIVIVQHMPKSFTARFAERLGRTTGKDVAEARDGEVLSPGAIRIAPGDQHLRVGHHAGKLVCLLDDQALMSGHRPSVDMLFLSVAEVVADQAVGIILTGMGRDGAKGMRAMRDAGAHTIGESAATCVVYGMPRAAHEAGAVVEERELGQIPACLENVLWGDQRSARLFRKPEGKDYARR